MIGHGVPSVFRDVKITEEEERTTTFDSHFTFPLSTEEVE
jgi:hypothetical protein